MQEISHQDVVATTDTGNGKLVLRFFHKDSPLSQKYKSKWPWERWFMFLQKNDEYKQVQKIVFDQSLRNFCPQWFAGLFQDMTSLKSIQGLDFLDTSKSINMSKVFSGCENLQELDLSSWDTHRVQSMEKMFSGCKKLRNLDLRGFAWITIQNLSGMFEDCYSLENLFVNVDDFYCLSMNRTPIRNDDMFWGCNPNCLVHKMRYEKATNGDYQWVEKDVHTLSFTRELFDTFIDKH